VRVGADGNHSLLVARVGVDGGRSLRAGVFDGHGVDGRQAAVFAADDIVNRLAADSRLQPGKIERQWAAAVTDACHEVGPLAICCFCVSLLSYDAMAPLSDSQEAAWCIVGQSLPQLSRVSYI
jgi:hypothetical protein